MLSRVKNVSQAPMAFSIAEFAAVLGVSASLVRAELKAKRLRSFRVGRRILIPCGEVARLERAGEADANR
jgi:excisionase family DNA binding protein